MNNQVMDKTDNAVDDVAKVGTVVFGSTAAEWGTDAYTINAVTVQDGMLRVNVSYSGGCETHAFTLVAEERFLESFPVQLRVSLAHNANGDTCEVSITEDYHFDLTPLKEVYQKGYQTDEGTIVLRLEGASSGELVGELVYEF